MIRVFLREIIFSLILLFISLLGFAISTTSKDTVLVGWIIMIIPVFIFLIRAFIYIQKNLVTLFLFWISIIFLFNIYVGLFGLFTTSFIWFYRRNFIVKKPSPKNLKRAQKNLTTKNYPMSDFSINTFSTPLIISRGKSLDMINEMMNQTETNELDY